MIGKRTCVICGKAYKYCNNCAEHINKPSWYALFDSENCNNIYVLCTDYRDGKITVQQAKELLDKCDLSLYDNFEKGAKEMITKINNEYKKVQLKANEQNNENRSNKISKKND